MLLDEHLPEWDVRTAHAIHVDAPPVAAYQAVRRLDLAASPVNRVLFLARGLRSFGALRLSDLMNRGFVLLGEDPPRELVLGAVARPWTVSGGAVRVDAEGFRTFHRPGYARIGWSFSVRPAGGGSMVATETRILCTDRTSRWRFGWYWRLVGPFSGVVRKEALRMIRGAAEQASRSSRGAAG